MENIISYYMAQKENCLRYIGRRMQESEDGPVKPDGETIVASGALKECIHCARQGQCTLSESKGKQLGQVLERSGRITTKELRELCGCMHPESVSQCINRLYEAEQMEYQSRLRFFEMRTIIGKQYLEAAQLIGSLWHGEKGIIRKRPDLLEKMEKSMKKYHLRVKEVYQIRDQGSTRLYLSVRKKAGKVVSVREVAVLLSKLLKQKYQPVWGNKKVLSNTYEIVGFQAAEKFHVLSGVVTKAWMDGTNGDNFSFGATEKGKYLSVISDGMGTGKYANSDSRRIVESLEELLAAGLDEKTAVEMLQTMYVFGTLKERYATLDFFLMDLYAGTGVFLKMGGCPSFLKRRGKVELIGKEGLPVGMEEGKLPFERKKMESGDLIVQISDGLVDALKEEGIEMIARHMEMIDVKRPQKFAEELMKSIQETPGFSRQDDMTMIVLGIWDKY